jgi:hypothetical protein
MNDLVDSIRFGKEMKTALPDLNNLEMIDYVIQEIQQACTDMKFELEKTGDDPERQKFYKDSKDFIRNVKLLATKYSLLEEEIQKQLNV